MHRNIRRGLVSGFFAAGLVVLGAQAASADNHDDTAQTSGADGILSGNQVLVDADAPVDVSGNAVAVAGDATTSDTGEPAPAPTGESTTATTDGQDSTAGGNQVVADADAPVDVSGNAVAVAGDATTSHTGEPAPAPTGESTTATTDGQDSTAGGNQVVVDADVPVTICDNAVSVLGDATTTGGSCEAPSSAGDPISTDATTDGTDSLLGGNQVIAPITAPVTAGDNAIAVVGDATTTRGGSAGNGTGTAPGMPGGGTGDDSRDAGTAGGPQGGQALAEGAVLPDTGGVPSPLLLLGLLLLGAGASLLRRGRPALA